MNPDRAIIVYHSQTEANQDMFVQMIFSSMFNHPVAWLAVIGAIVLAVAVIMKRS